MKNRPLDRFIAAFGFSLIATSLLSALLTVVKEVYAPLKVWMQDLTVTGQDWTTHALWLVAVFAALGYVLANAHTWKLDGWVMSTAVIAATVASGLIVTGFFLFV